MKIIGINASPRKNANTETLVGAVLDGAPGKGAETHMVNLRELNINGCLGCEGCKKHPGKCVQKDDLTPLMQEMATNRVNVHHQVPTRSMWEGMIPKRRTP
jgi:multimeric flavodoxin WrbA